MKDKINRNLPIKDNCSRLASNDLLDAANQTELLKIAGQMATYKGLASPYADDYPKSTPKSVVEKLKIQQETILSLANRIAKVARKLGI